MFRFSTRVYPHPRSRQQQPPRKELGEARRAEARDWVPPGHRGEARGAAALVPALRDVVERAVEKG